MSDPSLLGRTYGGLPNPEWSYKRPKKRVWPIVVVCVVLGVVVAFGLTVIALRSVRPGDVLLRVTGDGQVVDVTVSDAAGDAEPH